MSDGSRVTLSGHPCPAPVLVPSVAVAVAAVSECCCCPLPRPAVQLASGCVCDHRSGSKERFQQIASCNCGFVS